MRMLGLIRRRWICCSWSGHAFGLGIIVGWRHGELSLVLGPWLVEILPRE